MIGELFRKVTMCEVIFSHHHQPAGILVEAMHDAGAAYAANP